MKRIALTLCAMAVAATAVAAQTKPAPAAPAKTETKTEAPVPKAAPEAPALPVNIRIEVSITDQSGNSPAAKKVVTMIASDRQPTNVRSSASVPVANKTGSGSPVMTYGYKTVQINVDARPAILQKDPNKVSVNFGLEYLPTSRVTDQEGAEPGLTSWNERLSVILESGKPMIISQAADPTSDRKITVEITATILK
jgi:glucose/arabinose dehydrogenase